MNDSELVGELLQALINEVQALRKRVEKLPTDSPTDYRPSLEGLTKAVQALQQGAKQVVPVVDLSPITARLDNLDYNSRQRPEYTLSRYVQYGGYAFGLMVILLATVTWFAIDWRQERDTYAKNYTWADWRLRYLKQAEPLYYESIEVRFDKDANGVGRWIEQQEQADATRAAARKAAEQAAALTKQANRLEGKKTQTR